MQGSSIISSLCIPDFDDWMQGYMSKKYDSSFKKLWFGNNWSAGFPISWDQLKIW